MTVDLRLARKIRQPASQKLRSSARIPRLKEDVRHGMSTVTALGMELQSPLDQMTCLLMVPQFVMRKRIGTQKPPVVAIGPNNAVQQCKIVFQTVLSTAKPNQTEWAICLFEEKRIPRKRLHMLADQGQCTGPITINSPGQRLDVLPLPQRHAIHTLKGL